MAEFNIYIDPAILELIVELDYTNYKGVRSIRRVVPLGSITFKSTDEFHKEPGYFMKVFDLDRMAIRDYAMKDIHSWNKE